MLITATQKARLDLDNSNVLEKRMKGGVRKRFDDPSSDTAFLCTEIKLQEWLNLDDKSTLHAHFEMV